MTEERKEREFVRFVAYLQVIGIVLVVLGHSFHEYPGGAKDLPVNEILHSFRMPLFMFVSGFLMVFTTRRRRLSVKGFVANKMKRLLIPFFTLTLVTFTPRALLSGFADDTVHVTAAGFFNSFIYADCLPIPYYWFIQASFLLLVATYTLLSLSDRAGVDERWVYVSLVALFVALNLLPFSYTGVFSIDKAVQLGIYFSLGCLYCRYFRELDRRVRWTSPLTFLLSAALWAGMFVVSRGNDLYIICSVAGICMCVSLAKILEARGITVLDHLIGANYIIFLLSWYANVATQQILSHYVQWPWWCHSLLSLVCGIYIPWLGYRYLRRHRESRWVKVTAFLLGQRV